jgi:predicted phosphodiesterase
MKRLTLLFFLCLPALGRTTDNIKFAVIGDFGTESESAKKVSRLVKSWHPSFIITTGDNNYPTGEAETIDQNIGSLYSTFIYPYKGKYQLPTITENRFWPCLGNHDFGKAGNAKPYFDYFPALNGQFYYDFVRGPVHFFSLCSDRKCPDGIAPGSKQLLWAEEKIKASQAPWKIVYFHHPTYHSEVMTPDYLKWPSEKLPMNSEKKIDLPFGELRVNVVYNGHLHLSERLKIDDVYYVINGAGGDVCYKFCGEVNPKSIFRDDKEDGAILVEGNDKHLSFNFVATSGKIIDTFTLQK